VWDWAWGRRIRLLQDGFFSRRSISAAMPLIENWRHGRGAAKTFEVVDAADRSGRAFFRVL